MQFPLVLWDIILWLAVTAIILLATSEVISAYYGKNKIPIKKQKLRNVALIVGILFLITVISRVFEIVLFT